MKEYNKIQTVYKRDTSGKHHFLIEGDFSIPEFEYLQNNEWIFTEKVDGMNIRIMFDGNTVTFGGRTDNADIPSHLANKLNERFLPCKDKFREIFKESAVCLYGEGYGAKIQKGGGKYRADPGFVLFDVRIGEWWLQRKDIEDIAQKFGLDIVPVLGTGTLLKMVETVRSGFNSRWGNFTAEGIVARPATELRTRRGERIITKIKYKDFTRT